MKRKKISSVLVLIFSIFLIASNAQAQLDEKEDKTLSPYFFVKSDDPAIDQLPLKSTHAEVNIAGVIADVTVTQIYKNEGNQTLEAIYIFPASTKAAVYGLKMHVGERIITAKIKRRQEAQKEYDQAKRDGKTASLLEQHRPNVFQMNVANILPADVIKVELKYTELLVPTHAVYEFVYPTVVGPRYTENKNEDMGTAETWTANPYLNENILPENTFDIAINLMAGLPIQEITCSSHDVDLEYKGKNNAFISLKSGEALKGNRDFILKYRLAGGKIENGLLLYEGEKENFFLMMLQPPKQVHSSMIPPREYIFVVDVSGSMNGFPLNISKQLLKDLIGNLRPEDRFNVLLFAAGSSMMSEVSLPCTQDNIKKAIQVIEKQRGGGGTRLLPAMQKALSTKKTSGYSRSIVIVTDGYISVEEKVFELIRNELNNANIFSFGIGSSVNRHLIEGMARVGMGTPFVLTHPGQASSKSKEFREIIESPVLTDIHIDFGKFEVYDVEPPRIPDVLAERPVIIFGKYHGKPKGNITLSGISGNENYKGLIKVGDSRPSKANSSLGYLWARHRIALLSDYNRLHPRDERVELVTNLGLSYNLLTAYTSFIAVDSQKRRMDDNLTTIKQPIPLPHGVSDMAVGMSSSRLVKTKGMGFIPHGQAPTAALEEKIAGKRVPADKEVMKKDQDENERDLSKEEKDKFIKLQDIIVSKGLDKNLIQAILKKHHKTIVKCHHNDNNSCRSINKEIKVQLFVSSKGKVDKIKMEILNDPCKTLTQCIEKTLKSIIFPTLSGKVERTIIITYTL